MSESDPESQDAATQDAASQDAASQDAASQFITAEQAAFETERAVFGLTSKRFTARMTQPEAVKYVEYLFAQDGEELPDDIREFFAGPDEPGQ